MYVHKIDLLTKKLMNVHYDEVKMTNDGRYARKKIIIDFHTKHSLKIVCITEDHVHKIRPT